MTFASSKIPEKVNFGCELVLIRAYIKKPMRCTHPNTPRYDAIIKIQINLLVLNAGPHDTIENTLKCTNCEGPHQSDCVCVYRYIERYINKKKSANNALIVAVGIAKFISNLCGRRVGVCMTYSSDNDLMVIRLLFFF